MTLVYAIEFTQRAHRYLARMDRTSQERIAVAIKSLQSDPYAHPQTKPLHGFPDERAVRVGGWRVIYRVSQSEALIRIEEIGPRGQTYRRLS